jgi:hypothetical protein
MIDHNPYWPGFALGVDTAVLRETNAINDINRADGGLDDFGQSDIFGGPGQDIPSFAAAQSSDK